MRGLTVDTCNRHCGRYILPGCDPVAVTLMTAALSALLWFLSHHSIASFALLCASGALLSWWRRNPAYVLAAFALAMLNTFLGGRLNALYLDAVGEQAQAVIVEARQTSNLYNDHYVWRYEVVLRTAAGDDVSPALHSHTLSAWPLDGTASIPAPNQPFTVKHVPGFPRNILIPADQSPHGIASQRVEMAASKLRFSPDSTEFRAAYRQELERWLLAHGNDPRQQADAVRYRTELDALGP